MAAALCLFVAVSIRSLSGQSAAASPAQVVSTPQSQRALLDKYCVTCHNDRLKTANLSLQGLDLATVADHAERVGEGDSQDARRRDAAARPAAAARCPSTTACATGSKAEIDRAAAAKPNPGSVVLHRLNRTEYANAIRDLLDLRIDVTTLLPPDDSANGFDNIAGSLTLSPTLLESYTTAAARVARMAVGYWKSPTEATYLASSDASQNHRLDGMPFGTRGGIVARARFSCRRRIQVLDPELRRRQLHSRRAAGAHHRRRACARLAVSRRRHERRHDRGRRRHAGSDRAGSRRLAPRRRDLHRHQLPPEPRHHPPLRSASRSRTTPSRRCRTTRRSDSSGFRGRSTRSVRTTRRAAGRIFSCRPSSMPLPETALRATAPDHPRAPRLSSSADRTRR